MVVSPAALLVAAMGHMYDVVDEVAAFLPPPECRLGCMNWTDALNASEQVASFADLSILPSLGARCAFPGRALEHSFGQGRNETLSAMERAAFYGPICPCRTSSAASSLVEFHTCTAPSFVPEQINLQIANSTTVVVSFVTHEREPPTAPPRARLTGPRSTAGLSGVSHWYETSHVRGSKACVGPDDKVLRHRLTCAPRNITMHFIRFSSLEPRQAYTYQVRSGASEHHHHWSQPYTFRAPYGHGAAAAESDGSIPTRVALYGDMGNTVGNNMENLRAGCARGTIDAVLHMGDHAYNLGAGDDYHGDAYMQAFQGVLARCPWLPVIGNHESTLGSEHNIDASTEQRYLNQTYGVIFGTQDGVASETSTARTTATTSLGHLLTRGSFYGAASHGGGGGGAAAAAAAVPSATPSKTSQWYSVDFGLIHFVVLDLDPGPPAVFAPGGAQMAWAAADLAAADANRGNVPWIVVTSHYPLYAAMMGNEEADASAAWYTSELAEQERDGDGTPWSALEHFEACSGQGSGNATAASAAAACRTVRDIVEASISHLEPLLDQFRVDVYAAGHIHQYSVSWPIFGGAIAKQSFVDPHGTVHLVEGNGGVPGAHARSSFRNCTRSPGQWPISTNTSMEAFRKCGMGMNYGRLVTGNASVLTYEHVDNSNDRVTDSWSIVRTQTHRQR